MESDRIDPSRLHRLSQNEMKILESSAKALETHKDLDTLTPAERTVIQKAAKILAQDIQIPTLPTGDQKILSDWMVTSRMHAKQAMQQSGRTALRETPPTSNPYELPGIMAIMAALMTVLGPIYMRMQLTSADMEIKFMGLILESAKAIKEMTEKAGEARAKQLEADAKAHTTKMYCAITNSVAAGLNLGLTIKGLFAADTAREGLKTLKPEDNTVLNRLKVGSEAMQGYTTTGQAIFQLTQSVTGAISESAEADAARKKAKQAIIEAGAQTLSGMVEKLINTLESTKQKQAEAQKEATQIWHDFLRNIEALMQTSAKLGHQA